MKEPLIDVQGLFEKKLEENSRERENLVKARIESFLNRHRIAGRDDDSIPHNDSKVRPLRKQ
jgi:hypothetical protein